MEDPDISITKNSFHDLESLEVSDSDCSDEDFVLPMLENSSDEGAKDPEASSAFDTSAKSENCDFWLNLMPYRAGENRLPSVNLEASVCMSILDSWSLIISDDILDKVTVHTNRQILEKASKHGEKSKSVATNPMEMRAFIGLLYIAGVARESHANVEELWSEMYGPAVFHATMTLSRFHFLGSCIRFDDKASRPLRKLKDPFAAIREVWDAYVQNCNIRYRPSEYCTLGENLLRFRGKCPFRVYKQRCSEKCGVNVLVLCDAKTNYMVNAVPYLGGLQDSTEDEDKLHYVDVLTRPIQGSSTNVTMDECFASSSLADAMQNKFELTITGPLKKSKQNCLAQTTKNRDIGGFHCTSTKGKTFVSYTSQEKKSMVLLSTLNDADALDKELEKPKCLALYEKTKDSAEHFVRLCNDFSTVRKSSRWPLRIFYGILDQSAVNAMIMFSMVNPEWKIDRNHARRTFLKELGLALAKPWMAERQKMPTLRKNLKLVINSVVGEEETQTPQNIPGGSRRRCGLCPRKKDKKTAMQCQSCARPVCLDHRAMICTSCARVDQCS